MNLNDERNYQMCQKALDAMNLLEENRKLADEYLDPDQPENRSLLEKMTSQDFSRLSEEDMKKCFGYAEHLEKRARTEEWGRYVRFCAKVGGSTARYTLFNQWAYGISGPRGKKLREILTPEQAAAIEAEMIVWKMNSMWGSTLNIMVQSARENPEVYRRAMELCYHESANSKMLLAAIYLFVTKPSGSEKGIIKKLFSKTEKEGTEGTSGVASYLTERLIANIPYMFDAQQKLTEQDKSVLKGFLETADANAPFTGDIQAVLSKAGVASSYLVYLFAGTAFMSIEHSDRFVLLARFLMYVDLYNTLTIGKNMCGIQWFSDRLALLEQALPVKTEDYCCWCARNQVGQPLQRMAKSDPDAIRRLPSSLSTVEFQFLMEYVAKGNPSLHQEINTGYREEFRNRMASELTARFNPGRMEAMNYLLGKLDLKQLYPFIEEWKKQRWGFLTWDDYKKMAQLRDGKDVSMFQRAFVLEAVGCKVGFCISNAVYPSSQKSGTYNYSNKPADKQQIMAIFDILEKEEVPVNWQLEFLEALCDGYYSDSNKNACQNECVKALAQKKSAWTQELTDGAKNGSAMVRLLCIRTLDVYSSEFKELLLSCALDSSKLVREFLVKAYASHKEWEPEITAMLTSKKSQERELSIQVLGKWGAASYREQLEKALEAEKSKKIKDQIMALLGMEIQSDDPAQPVQAAAQTVDQLATDLLKGGKKRKVEWTSEAFVSPVHKLDGTEASTEYLQALLVAYADMNNPGVSQDAARLAAELNPKELADFMGLLFTKWMDTGAEAKKKWVLYAVSIHGGDTIVPTLHHQIQVWPEAARGAIAAEAVRALALNGSSTALLLVDQIARKFKNRQVKTAAGDALSYAAEQLGITRAELEDRIVPNLDFDEKQERHFDYGTRAFRVKLTSALELEIFDGSGKKLKSMPAPGKQDDEEKAKAASEAFKLMKKQLKTVVTNQKLRLEQALSTERLWPADKWQELFVKNPIMHQFAIGLIWGVYSREEQETKGQALNTEAQISIDGSQTPESEGLVTGGSSHGITLTTTFRYMEDGSFNTVDEEEYELPENAQIGLVHPVELSAETLAAWKEQLSDYEVTQPFDQLERPVYRITEEEKSEKELTRFGGVLLNGLSLSGKLLGQGWYRGPVEDAGFYVTYYRNDGANGVELEFSGSPVGYEGEEDVTVYGIYFYPSGEDAQGGYRYQKDYEKKRCLLSEVSPRYFSEIVLLMTRATASSKERLAYPDCK